MGSQAHIIVNGPARLADMAVDRLADLEQRWSRFRPDSEVSLLNASAGRAVVISPPTRLLIVRSLEAWRITGGAFDPTVLGDVVRAGYDRSFAELSGLPGSSPLERGADRIAVDRYHAALPAGVGFDPGGLGKGLAADLIATELREEGAGGACVNVGGDVRVVGVAPGDEPWRIAVDDPWSGEALARLALDHGALATSSVLRRTWSAGGRDAHHLIDPRSGEPATTSLATVTVAAAECWQAEALTKAVFLAPAPERFALVDRLGSAALVVERDGRMSASARWSSLTTEVAA